MLIGLRCRKSHETPELLACTCGTAVPRSPYQLGRPQHAGLGRDEQLKESVDLKTSRTSGL